MNTSQRKGNIVNKKNDRRKISFYKIPISSTFLDVSNSFVSSFEFMRSFTKLISLNASNTLIKDVMNAQFHSKIESLFLVKSPICENENYRLMVLICIGTQIKSIDGVVVKDFEYSIAKKFQVICQPYLFKGFSIVSTSPLTVSDGQTTINVEEEFNSNGQQFKSVAELKSQQTLTNIESIVAQIDTVSRALKKPIKSVDVKTVLESGDIKREDIISIQPPISENKTMKQSSLSPFQEAYNKYLGSPKSFLNASQSLNSPEKRKERWDTINNGAPKYSIDPDKFISTPRKDKNDDLVNDATLLSLSPTKDYDHSYDSLIKPKILDNPEISVEDIFVIAAQAVSPIKNIEQSNQSINSCIPIRIDSPKRNFYSSSPKSSKSISQRSPKSRIPLKCNAKAKVVNESNKKLDSEIKDDIIKIIDFDDQKEEHDKSQTIFRNETIDETMKENLEDEQIIFSNNVEEELSENLCELFFDIQEIGIEHIENGNNSGDHIISVEEEVKPLIVETPPTEKEPKPVEEDDKPTEAEHKSVEDVEPIQVKDKPTEVEVKQIEVEVRPIQEEVKPVQAVDKPTEIEVKLVEEEHKSDEVEVKSTEEFEIVNPIVIKDEPVIPSPN